MFNPRLVANATALVLASSALLSVADSSGPSATPPVSSASAPGVVASAPQVNVSDAARAKAAALVTEATAIIDAYTGSTDPLQKAMTNLNEALELDPGNPRVYIEYARLGITWTGLTPFTLQRSELALRKAIEVDPNAGDAYVLLGYVFAHSDRTQDAEAAFAKGRGLPHTKQWLDAMTAELGARQQFDAEVAEQSRREEKALANAMARAVADANGNARVAAQRLSDEAAKLLDEAGNTSRHVMGEASEKLSLAMKLDARVPRAHVEMARFVMKANGVNEPSLQMAEQSLRTAIDIDPQFGDAYVLLGYVLNHAGRLDEAAQAFARAEQTPHTSVWLESNIAELKSKQGKEQEAIETFARVAADTRNPVGLRVAAYFEIEQYYALTGARDLADRAYQQHIALTPDAVTPKIRYGHFLRVFRLDLPRSEAYLREALKRSDSPTARSTLAKTLYMKWAEVWIKDRNSAKAAAIFAEASALDPDLRDLVDDLGRLQRPHPILDALVAKGVSLDVSSAGPGATTPLSSAAKFSSLEVVRQMIRLGAHPNTPGYDGFTGLMAAAWNGNVPMVKLLLDSGADPGLRTTDGHDAEWYARDRGDTPLATLLADAKRRFIPTAATTPSTPFKVGFAYRVKKDWEVDQWSTESRFKGGETVVFDHETEYGDLGRARFYFWGKEPYMRQFSTPRDRIAAWSDYFEEIGPAPRRQP